MKKCIFFILMSLISLNAFAQDTTQTIIDFSGELVDQSAIPVSGVLPLEFRIYSDSKYKKLLTTEKHFVSVIDGNYFISLGETSKIQSRADTLYVVVYLDKKELTRQEVSVQHQIVSPEARTTRTTSAGSEEGNSFSLSCPAGYVVTGIEGTDKDGIQGLRLICSKTI